MLRFIFVFALLVVIFTNCKEAHRNNHNKISYTKQEIKIPITENQISYYTTTSFFEKRNHFLGYNEFKHSIDIFSLESTEFIKSIFLQREGPEYIDKPNAFYQFDDNELVSIDYFHITFFDSTGTVKKRININSKSEHPFFYLNFLYPNQDNGFHFMNNFKEMIVFNANMKESTSVNPQAYYQNYSLFTKIDVEGNPIDLSIPFAKEYHEKFYGFNDIVFSSIENEMLYFNFSALPDIFSFNLKTKELNRGQVSTNTLPLYKTESISFDQANNTGLMIDTFLKSANFGPILTTNDYIIRVYQSGAPEGQQNLTASRDYKQKIIQVFDKDYRLLKDIPFDFNITFSGVFNFGNTLFLQKPPLDDNSLLFEIIKLTKN